MAAGAGLAAGRVGAEVRLAGPGAPRAVAELCAVGIAVFHPDAAQAPMGGAFDQPGPRALAAPRAALEPSVGAWRADAQRLAAGGAALARLGVVTRCRRRAWRGQRWRFPSAGSRIRNAAPPCSDSPRLSSPP